MVIPMLKIRRPTGRLIFNMGIPIPGKTVFYIETGPWLTLGQWYDYTSDIEATLMTLDKLSTEGPENWYHNLGKTKHNKTW